MIVGDDVRHVIRITDRLIGKAFDPAQQMVRLAQEGSDVYLEAAGPGGQIRARIGSDSGVTGSIAIPIRALVELVKAVEVWPINVEIQDNLKARFVAGSLEVVLRGVDPFRVMTNPWPTIDGDRVYEVHRDTLLQQVQAVMHAAYPGYDRVYIRGVYMDNERGRAVATDGHMLLYRQVPGFQVADRSFILPLDVLGPLADYLKYLADETVRTYCHDKAFYVESSSSIIGLALLDGVDYPDYERVLPKVENAELEIDMDVDELKHMLSKADVVCADAVELAIRDGRIMMHAEGETGKVQTKIVASASGESTGRFDPRLLRKALGKFHGDVKAWLFRPLGAQLFVKAPSTDGVDYRAVVMGMADKEV